MLGDDLDELDDFDELAIDLGWSSYDAALAHLAAKFGFTTFDELVEDAAGPWYPDPDDRGAYLEEMTDAERQIWEAE